MSCVYIVCVGSRWQKPVHPENGIFAGKCLIAQFMDHCRITEGQLVAVAVALCETELQRACSGNLMMDIVCEVN